MAKRWLTSARHRVALAEVLGAGASELSDRQARELFTCMADKSTLHELDAAPVREDPEVRHLTHCQPPSELPARMTRCA
jgi:hypothetical protein